MTAEDSMDTMHVETPAPDDLQDLRRLAGALVNPWPERATFGELTSQRQQAVQQAAKDLVALAAKLSQPTRQSGVSNAPRKARAAASASKDEVTPEMEASVGVSLRALASLFALDGVSGFGPQKFKHLTESNIDPEAALRNPKDLPFDGKTGDQLRAALSRLTPDDRALAEQRAARQISVAFGHGAQILTFGHPAYPRNIYTSNNPVPFLYARGDMRVLENPRAVACVGSREIREPYATLQYEFARFAADRGWTISSGFALGADTIAHRAAVNVKGDTVCVMPCGLDRPFPPENKDLFTELLATPGVAFVSEFPFGTGASAMNLRKRNKTIVAAARGVLVGQSSSKGGAMNAFRFGLEQKKPVATFQHDGAPDTTGNRDIASSEKGATHAFSLDRSFGDWAAWLSNMS